MVPWPLRAHVVVPCGVQHADPAVSSPFTPAMAREAQEYYAAHYLLHFTQASRARAECRAVHYLLCSTCARARTQTTHRPADWRSMSCTAWLAWLWLCAGSAAERSCQRPADHDVVRCACMSVLCMAAPASCGPAGLHAGILSATCATT